MRVALRKEKISKGRQSLYLDVYIEQDQHYQKRLKMYLDPPISAANKEKNKQTLRIAELVRNKLELEILNKKHDQHDPRQDYNFNFIEYFDKLVAHRFETNVNHDTWLSVKRHLHRYTKKRLRFEEINEIWLEGFKSYLLSKVSQNSAHSYFNILKRAVHTAHREKLIDEDSAHLVKSPKIVNTKREYLTKEELRALKQEDCRYPILKKAFFFSCLCGVRWSDIQKLKWNEVVEEDGGCHLVFTQKKTREAERLPIHRDARNLLGERKADDERVFVGLAYSAWHNVAISQWMIRAGIKKHITFHCARHTHATLLLKEGVDLFTISKLLGHKELKTTQIYAKLVNSTKVDAVQKLTGLF